MPVSAQDILTRVVDLIQDTSYARNTVAELLRFLSDGRREMCEMRPSIYSVIENGQLQPGTKQTLPSGGVRLLDVTRNMKASVPAGGGAPVFTPGRAVRVIEREILDAQKPNWHSETQSATIQHFMYDERTPNTYYVYPPASPQAYLELAYAKAPDEVTSPTTNLSEQESIYAGALTDYVCYRALSKDTEYGGADARVSMHYQQFLGALGLGSRTSMMSSPNMARIDGVPPRATSIQG
jgi:hypothetical protein